MENWVIYGLIASLCFGINAVIYKVAATRGQGINPYLGVFSVGLGVFLFFSLVYLIKSPKFIPNWTGLTLALIAGIVWAAGFLMITLAIANKADISRLAPIYNTNTLIAVLLGMIFLKELPAGSEIIKVISGAVLIVIGAVLVSS
ncbi:EamA family transporter [Candidatus Woesearchaeota archaeon]|nr:EamA family transporter [Candidatus Woesearchaeota archaeon]